MEVNALLNRVLTCPNSFRCAGSEAFTWNRVKRNGNGKAARILGLRFLGELRWRAVACSREHPSLVSSSLIVLSLCCCHNRQRSSSAPSVVSLAVVEATLARFVCEVMPASSPEEFFFTTFRILPSIQGFMTGITDDRGENHFRGDHTRGMHSEALLVEKSTERRTQMSEWSDKPHLLHTHTYIYIYQYIYNIHICMYLFIYFTNIYF